MVAVSKEVVGISWEVQHAVHYDDLKQTVSTLKLSLCYVAEWPIYGGCCLIARAANNTQLQRLRTKIAYGYMIHPPVVT